MTAAASPPALLVRDLRVEIGAGPRAFRPVDGVSFDLSRGQTLALVGESGCGKTLTALALLGLLPEAARRRAAVIQLDGLELTTASEPALRAVRGRRIAMIFQQPTTALNPVLPIGRQVEEVLRVHRRQVGRERAAAIALLEQVGIAAAARRVDDYPHQLSGGMLQRVMIAAALAGEPEVLIADEPTTALDVTIQAQILELLGQIQRQRGLAILLITHDLGVVAHAAERVAVMYAGRIVETGPTDAMLRDPQHPYTAALLRASPRLAQPIRRLSTLGGEVLDPRRRPAGCAFEPRCELGRGDAECVQREPALEAKAPERAWACWKVAGESRTHA